MRNVNIDELVSKAIEQRTQTLLKNSGNKSSRVIENDDLSAMFGIDMDRENERPPLAKVKTSKN